MGKRATTEITERESDRTSADPSDILTERQRLFVEEYLRDGNGTQAAIRAGYSARSAHVLAHDLLKNPRVRDALRGRHRARAQMADVNAASVLKLAQRLAFYDVRQLFDAAGNLLNPAEIPDDMAAAIQGIEVEGALPGMAPRVKLKLADKGAAADRLMRHLGLFSEDNRQGADAVSQMLSAIHGQGSRLPVKGRE